jgi:hypothetical protein
MSMGFNLLTYCEHRNCIVGDNSNDADNNAAEVYRAVRVRILGN